MPVTEQSLDFSRLKWSFRDCCKPLGIYFRERRDTRVRDIQDISTYKIQAD